jgi:hypothetical protein
MRKLSVMLLAMISIASLSFAEIKFVGGWGCVEFDALQATGTATPTTQVGASWGGNDSAGINFAAKGDKGGLYSEWGLGGDTFAVNKLYFWQNPVDGLKLIVGSKAAIGTLQVHSNNDIFTQLNNANGAALVAEYTGVQNLYLGLAIPTTLGSANALAATYSATQFAADYTLAGVGRIRAQYIGDSNTTDTNYGSIEAAILTAGTLAKGLNLEVGIKAPLQTNATYKANIEVAYSNGPFWAELWLLNNITPSATAAYNGTYSVEATYNISGPFTAGLYVKNEFASSTSDKVQAKPYFQIQHGLDSGYIRSRVYFQMDTDVLATTPSVTWKVPVYLEYCFW